MATRSKATRAGARKPQGSSAGSVAKKGTKTPAFRRLDETFKEWRFEAAAGGGQYAAMVLLSLGAVALGAALYGVVLSTNPTGPARYASYIFAAGALLLAIGMLLNQPSSKTLRVGLFGVGFEEDGKSSRARWYEIKVIELAHGALRVVGGGKPLTLALKQHGPAVRRIVAEANKRVPSRVELDDDALRTVGKPLRADGQRVLAEAPQVTSERCRASDKALTFEEDVRLCGCCAVAYHKTYAPRTCLECGNQLKR